MAKHGLRGSKQKTDTGLQLVECARLFNIPELQVTPSEAYATVHLSKPWRQNYYRVSQHLYLQTFWALAGGAKLWNGTSLQQQLKILAEDKGL